MWLLGFQTLHRFTHDHDHHTHHEHQHIADWGSIHDESSHQEECRICELISLPFTFAESWSSPFPPIIQNSSKGSFIASASYVADVLYAQHRGPPVIA